jgi:hypothetical protein
MLVGERCAGGGVVNLQRIPEVFNERLPKGAREYLNERIDEAVRNARTTGCLPNICQADPLSTEEQMGIPSL